MESTSFWGLWRWLGLSACDPVFPKAASWGFCRRCQEPRAVGLTLRACVAGAAWAALPSLVFFEAPLSFLGSFQGGAGAWCFPSGVRHLNMGLKGELALSGDLSLALGGIPDGTAALRRLCAVPRAGETWPVLAPSISRSRQAF